MVPESSKTKPLIVVTGATGAQGGSVVKFLLNDGGFRIRAITRNVNSPKAKELVAEGVEVVRANFDEPATLVAAFTGAHGVFANTNFWELGEDAVSREIIQGKALVDAAKEADVKHFVWSTLDQTSDPEVRHCNSKARVNDYLKESGIPRTSLYTAFYFENFIMSLRVTKAADSTLEVNWPFLASDGPIGAYSVADTGAYVLESFKKPHEWINKDLKIMTEIFTPREVVRVFEEVSGMSIKLHDVSFEAFEALKNDSKTREMWTHMTPFYKTKGNLNGDSELWRGIYPQQMPFRVWAHNNIAALIPQ